MFVNTNIFLLGFGVLRVHSRFIGASVSVSRLGMLNVANLIASQIFKMYSRLSFGIKYIVAVSSCVMLLFVLIIFRLSRLFL